jgi:Uncharacterized conserved protein
MRKEVLDDKGRVIRPAFLDARDSLTIFSDEVSRQNYIRRNRYVISEDGIWKSEGLPDCKDVIVRDGGHNFWEVVPEAEAASLRRRLLFADPVASVAT